MGQGRICFETRQKKRCHLFASQFYPIRKTYPRRPRPSHTNRRVDPESPESRIVVHVVMLSRASHTLRRAVALVGAVAPAAHSHTARRLLATQAAAKAMGVVRHDWTNEEVEALYNRPLLDLVYDAASVHRANHDPRQVQQCTLLSIKTGGLSLIHI